MITMSLCLVIVMRTTAVDEKHDDGSHHPSTSSVVDSLIIDNDEALIKTVGVNNCVNINSNSNDTSTNNNYESFSDDQSLDDVDRMQIIADCLAAELDGDDDDDEDGGNDEMTDDYDDGGDFGGDKDKDIKIDDSCGGDASGPSNINNINSLLFRHDDDDDDEDARTSSKYLDVTSQCGEPSSTSSTSASKSALSHETHVVSRTSSYTSSRDNNRKHQKAVRKNFSLWIGVTSCVWGLLLLLMKNYADQ